MSAESLIRRVAVREYGPLAAIVLAWLAIGLTTGHADAVRLFAALTFVRHRQPQLTTSKPLRRAPIRRTFWPHLLPHPYLHTVAVAVFVNVVVVVTFPDVTTFFTCAPLPSNVSVPTDFPFGPVCVVVIVLAPSSYAIDMLSEPELPLVGRPALSHAV